ncbi:MAG TPA: enoyl-CoA hydratase/isomerase family protein [Blastocatellia bacterium]|nr:enoyl-CoA hydratase/isomerase family protein [Blastocatellia bacterium]
MADSSSEIKLKHLSINIADGIGTITICRPPHNAYNSELFENIYEAFLDILAPDDRVKVIIVTGGIRNCFGAGAYLDQLFGPGIAEDLREKRDYTFHRVRIKYSEIARIPKPTIAAINGVCIGASLELALMCDLRVASELAYFSLPEADLKIITTGGATVYLPRIIGAGRAKEMLLLGRRISAQTALDWGLVNWLTPQREVFSFAKRIAEDLLKKHEPSLHAFKDVIDFGLEHGIEKGFYYESETFIRLMRTKLVENGEAR